LVATIHPDSEPEISLLRATNFYVHGDATPLLIAFRPRRIAFRTCRIAFRSHLLRVCV
jgi:hypothetical protein